MSVEASKESRVFWTGADMFSTYRFWGLFAFYTLCLAPSSVVITPVMMFSYDRFGLSSLSRIMLALGLFAVCGFWLAWSSRLWNAKRTLYWFSLVELVGVAFFVIGYAQGSLAWFYAGAFFFAVGTGAILLGVPAIIAGGRGGVEGFLLAFGIMFTASTVAGTLYRLMPGLLNWLSVSQFYIIAIGLPVVAGLVFLLPVNRALFSTEPPARGPAFPPEYRDPVGVAILMFVPLYNIYHLPHWLYRAHGEAAFLSPSRSLLSPRAAIAAAFVPLLAPLATTMLVSHLDERPSTQGAKSSAKAVFVWSLILLPVGMGLAQAAINRADSRSAHGAPSPFAPGLRQRMEMETWHRQL